MHCSDVSGVNSTCDEVNCRYLHPGKSQHQYHLSRLQVAAKNNVVTSTSE